MLTLSEFYQLRNSCPTQVRPDGNILVEKAQPVFIDGKKHVRYILLELKPVGNLYKIISKTAHDKKQL